MSNIVIDELEKSKSIITESEENTLNFNKLTQLFTKYLGIIVIDHFPKKQDSLRFDYKDDFGNNYFLLTYEIKENSKNNFITDFNFIIQLNNIERKFSRIKDFLLYILSIDYFERTINLLYYLSIGKENNQLYDKIRSIILLNYYNEMQIIFKRILINLNPNRIGIINSTKIFIEKQYTDLYITNAISDKLKESKNEKIINYANYLSQIFDSKKAPAIQPSLIELLDLMYYQIIENHFNYDRHEPNFFKIIFDEVLMVSENDLFINPIILNSNINLIEKYINDLRKGGGNLILNGRYFFNLIPIKEYESASDIDEKNTLLVSMPTYLHYKFIRNSKETLKAIQNKAFTLDKWNNLGIYTNQFAMGEIYLKKADSADEIVIHASIHPIMEFYGDNYEQIYSSFYLDKKIKLELKNGDLNLDNYLDQIKKYIESVFFIYPMHSDIIGCNDWYFYYGLYDYFPLLRYFQIPLVNNLKEIFEEMTDISTITKTEIFGTNYGDTNNTTAYINRFKWNELFTDIKIRAKMKEEIYNFNKLKEKVDHVLDLFGMNFGNLTIGQELTKGKLFTDKMQKYNDKDQYLSYLKLNNLDFEKLYESIYFLIVHDYYFEINYFIENFIRIKKIANYFNEYNFLDGTLCNLAFHGYYYIKERIKWFIPYPFVYTTLNIVINTGVNLLFRELDKDNVILVKLNKMPFNKQELDIIETILSVKTKIVFDNDDLLSLNKYEISNGIILLKNIEKLYESISKFSKKDLYNFISAMNSHYYESLIKEHQYFMSEKVDNIYKEDKKKYLKMFNDEPSFSL